MITSLPVWVWFPAAPVEYYNENWLRRVEDQIGRTIKVDNTTLATTRGKFARVHIEIDLQKLLRARYRTRGRNWQL